MRKIITVLMVLMVATSVFAYIPNKKNVEKYGDCIVYGYKYKNIYGDKEKSYITYNTKTGEIYFNHYKYIEFIKKTYSQNKQEYLINDIEKMWKEANEKRKNYRFFKEAGEDRKNEKKTALSDKYYSKAMLLTAKEIEKRFIDDYPFFTEENWLTLTKEEWNKMAKDFLENN